MQPQYENPMEIEGIYQSRQNNMDLFEQLLYDQNYEAAMPKESFSIQNRRIIQSEERRDHQGCKCTKIDCLKLYCQCFARGLTCNENCICVSCRNKQQNQEQIYVAKQIANYRNPGFFKDVPAFVPLRKCTCKKSLCIKKYCQCYSAGLKCTEECECISCQNGKCNHHDHEEEKIYSVGIPVHA